MEIELDKKEVASAEINLVIFKKWLSKEMDLELAFEESFKLTYDKFSDAKLIKSFFYKSLDWGYIIKFIGINPTEKKLDLKLYWCQINGLRFYKPNNFDVEMDMEGNNNSKVMNLKMDEETIKNKTFYLVVDSSSPRLDKHIEYMLSTDIIDYVNKEWKMKLKIEEKGVFK